MLCHSELFADNFCCSLSAPSVESFIFVTVYVCCLPTVIAEIKITLGKLLETRLEISALTQKRLNKLFSSNKEVMSEIAINLSAGCCSGMRMDRCLNMTQESRRSRNFIADLGNFQLLARSRGFPNDLSKQIHKS